MSLAGAFLAGLNLVGTEDSVRDFDVFELLGLVGVFGTAITAVQMAVLERESLLAVKWELWEVSVLLAALAVAQFAKASCVPYMLRLSSSAGLTLCLLATDFYAIVAGVVFFEYKVKCVLNAITWYIRLMPVLIRTLCVLRLSEGETYCTSFFFFSLFALLELSECATLISLPTCPTTTEEAFGFFRLPAEQRKFYAMQYILLGRPKSTFLTAKADALRNKGAAFFIALTHINGKSALRKMRKKGCVILVFIVAQFHWLYMISAALVFSGIIVFYLKPVLFAPPDFKKQR